jgi:hypothetical protein
VPHGVVGRQDAFLLRIDEDLAANTRSDAAAVGAGAGCTAIGIRANRAAGRAICVKPIGIA